jgi:hypothetical protein
VTAGHALPSIAANPRSDAKEELTEAASGTHRIKLVAGILSVWGRTRVRWR